MKALDLLKYMNMADSKYVEEASDRHILLLRKRRKRTYMMAAACIALVVLVGTVSFEPITTAWEMRNTVVSWPSPTLPGAQSKPSSGVYVSAALPTRKKMDADQPFVLSVGLGQVSGHRYATLSINAQGFEITDKDGHTVTDRYVRTLSDFNSEDYEMLYNHRRNIAGCGYLEEFTFRFVGSENYTGWGSMDFSLCCRGEAGLTGDTVTVYYTVKNGALKLTDRRPAEDTWGHGVTLEEETAEGVVTLSKEDISVRVSMESSVLTPGQFVGDLIEIQAIHIPTQENYPTDGFTAKLVYAETLRKEDFSFAIRYAVIDPTIPTISEPLYTVPIMRVPDNAPMGSYDLVIADEDTGFVWIFENMAWVLYDDGEKGNEPELMPPPYEDFVCEAEASRTILAQGEDHRGAIRFTLTHNGEDVSLFCTAKLIYTGDGGLPYAIIVDSSGFISIIPSPYIPMSAPVGTYDLVVTHDLYGYTWLFEDFIEIAANPDADPFVFFHDMKDTLVVSRSAEAVYTFTASVENRGEPFTVTGTNDSGFFPEAMLTVWRVSGAIPENIPLRAVTGPYQEPYEWTVRTGTTGSLPYEFILDPETPCGLYDLVLSYGGCVTVFEGVVEVVP